MALVPFTYLVGSTWVFRATPTMGTEPLLGPTVSVGRAHFEGGLDGHPPDVDGLAVHLPGGPTVFHLLRYSGGSPFAPQFQFYICFYDLINLMLLPRGWGPASLEGLPITRAALLRREVDARWRAQPSHLWGSPKSVYNKKKKNSTSASTCTCSG
jgi:hypothetical protein